MAEEPLFCLRVRYVETGRLRYLSHLELLRALERTVRRAGLPYAVTQGFSPRMKAAYCPALPVGVASCDEWFDLWLRAYRPADEYLAALRKAAPADLAPCEAAYVDLRTPSLSAALTLATWRVDLAPWDDAPADPALVAACAPEAVRAAFERVVDGGAIGYLRNGKPRSVSLEGKFAAPPRFEALDLAAGTRVEVTTRSSNEGALRPDVLMDAVVRQLAETCAGRAGGATADGASWTRCLRISIMRTAQYLEGEDGSWVRPM